MKGITVSEDVRARIVELRKAGRKLDQIAADAGVSVSGVSKVLRRAGLTDARQAPATGDALVARRARLRELVEQERTDAEIAAILGITVKVVGRDRCALGLQPIKSERALPGEGEQQVVLIDPSAPTPAARFIERAASSSGSWRAEFRDGLHAPDQRIAFTTSHPHKRPATADDADLMRELAEAEERAAA